MSDALYTLPVTEGLRLELHRLEPAGAMWLVVEEDIVTPVSVPQAAALAGGGWWDLLQATKAELEYWDESETWSGRLDTEHPSDYPAVRDLLNGWQEAWGQLTAAEEATPRPVVPAYAVTLITGGAREHDDLGGFLQHGGALCEPGDLELEGCSGFRSRDDYEGRPWPNEIGPTSTGRPVPMGGRRAARMRSACLHTWGECPRDSCSRVAAVYRDRRARD